MVKKSKLLLALDAHKGRDYEKERQKKLAKAAEKRKAAKKAKSQDEKENEEHEEQEELNEKKKSTDGTAAETNGVEANSEKDQSDESESESESGSESEEDGESDGENESKEGEGENENKDSEEEEDEDIPLSDLSEDETQDVIPHQRLTINNSAAINASIKRISFITPQTPFSEHNSLVSSEPINVPDPNDDLQRELEFYKVCQAAAVDGRRLLIKEGIPFSRPGDYFAEMVKTDEHMNKIKQKLYEEAAAKKAAAEARRQRELKKFGKQVQIAKLQQRQKEKKETLEKINSLKRKRKAEQQSGPTEDEDLFDVAIEEAHKAEKKNAANNKTGGPSAKRRKKNEKYGFGGKKRYAKSGDAISSGDLSGFSVKKMKGGSSSAKKKAKKTGEESAEGDE
ncbi:rRNA processing protein (Ebp2) [Rasamsonia emersonii CBS 393.64]|uniref:rRNA processing protein (Ebp2) n=1 Tax=Rasamsonia emersonii (strain ATCC 16479 / CBS 393.64 / IMI 116815) TaxID=1408163 RepID=A0A0F4YLC1_RASE3|nr:rRNA processing protein (Ebp2) [Rasamsonia emersonii CBS 393.64]KKA18636.1 rRNA processing protein (Ebp2) [Rasamsonia emersonii CBS 393.64]